MAACCSVGEVFSPRLFKALSDPSRIALLASLAEACGPRTVSELSTCCPQDLSVVSRHLSVLREAGVVTSTKVGRKVLYQVRYQELSGLLRRMADAIDACCPDGVCARPPGGTETTP